MRNARLVVAALLLASLPACLSIAVDRAYDPRFDFATASTYDWAPKYPETGLELPYDLIDSALREAVDETLADKGFVRSSEDPSFLVTYYVGSEEVTEITEDYYGYGWGGYWGYGWYGPTGVNVSQYDQTSITIDILSSGLDSDLVWRGIGKGTINLTARERRVNRIIRRTVGEIFKKFPPELN